MAVPESLCSISDSSDKDDGAAPSSEYLSVNEIPAFILLSDVLVVRLSRDGTKVSVVVVVVVVAAAPYLQPGKNWTKRLLSTDSSGL